MSNDELESRLADLETAIAHLLIRMENVMRRLSDLEGADCE